MTTTYPDHVYRKEKACTKVGAAAAVPGVIFIPEGVYDLTLLLVGDFAASAKAEESYSTPAAVGAGTATWRSVDSTLDSVGTSSIRYVMAHTPVAVRVTALVNDKTATLILTGKKPT